MLSHPILHEPHSTSMSINTNINVSIDSSAQRLTAQPHAAVDLLQNAQLPGLFVELVVVAAAAVGAVTIN